MPIPAAVASTGESENSIWDKFDILDDLIYNVYINILRFFYPADPGRITSREVYQEFQPSDDIFRRSGAKGCSDHRFRAPTACTATEFCSMSQENWLDVLGEIMIFYTKIACPFL